MQFLLLLSALLSAVTGAFAGPRPMGAGMEQAEAQVVASALPAARAQAAAVRPANICARIVETAKPLPQEPAVAAVSPPLASVCLIE